MPVRVRRYSALGILIAEFVGRVTLEDVHVALAEARAIPEYLDGAPMLLDLRRLEESPDVRGWVELGRLLTTLPLPRGSRRAVVAPTDLYFGLSRMMQAHAEGAPARYDVFRTFDDALGVLLGMSGTATGPE